MLKKLLALFATTVLLGACAETPPPPPPPPPAPAAPTSFMVFFDWDSIKLSDTSLNVISQAAGAFRTVGNARITATGHTDTTGTPEYNMALSLRRANAVKNELVRVGVPAAAISVVGMGEKGLLVQTGDGVREPQNRRVEIVISGQMASAKPMDDQAYCTALVNAYRQGPTPRGSLMPDNSTAVAIAQCQEGGSKATSSIPVLVKALQDAKVPVPPRT